MITATSGVFSATHEILCNLLEMSLGVDRYVKPTETEPRERSSSAELQQAAQQRNSEVT